LDDPKFRIGKVVTRAIENILEKVATSPFSLLGAVLGGGGEELGWQDFAAGSAELTAADKKKLDTLAKGLYARPALKLEIAGSIDPAGDREGLERLALDQAIRTRLWMKLRKSERATTAAAQIAVPPEVRAKYIEKMTVEAFATHKLTPEIIAAHTNLAAYVAEAAKLLPPSQRKKGGQLLMIHAKATVAAAGSPSPAPPTKLVPPPDPQEALLLVTFPVSDDELATLAASRAQAVQAYLLQNGKVDGARIFVTAGGAGNPRRDGSRAYLQFR
jgi:hypothetical protein